MKFLRTLVAMAAAFMVGTLFKPFWWPWAVKLVRLVTSQLK